MVFKHNKLPFEHDDSIELTFQHVKQLDCGSQYAFSAHRHIPKKSNFPDEIRPGSIMKFEDMTFVTPDKCGSSLNYSSNLSWVTTSNDEIVRSENSKRPLDTEETRQLAAKRTRQMDRSLPSFSYTCEESFISFTADDDLTTRKVDALHESAKDSHGSSYVSFQLVTSHTSEDTPVDPLICPYSFPGYYEDHQQPSQHDQVEPTRSPVFNSHPRKLVALGPDHQADIPLWRPKSFQKSPRGDASAVSTSSVPFDEDSTDKWTGHCVIPMPDLDSLGSVGPVEISKTDCYCLDTGSIRCVRQHVTEARIELRSSLRHAQFLELGLCNMGEDVSLEWTEEDEQLFHEVVMSNPASAGKNFWNYLPHAFPSRSSKELVSYYFNVFMLQKRAEQNRSDHLDVDSDNDEWQESDDGEFGAEEEDDDDDDSGVESPVVHANGEHGDGEVDIHEGDEEEYGISDGFVSDSKLEFETNAHTGEDQDVYDDSCTSFEGQQNGDNSSGVTEDLNAEYRNDGISGGITDHDDFVLGHCDPKPWEIGYIRGFEKDFDFLPTCNVIEEVFGHDVL